MTHDETQGKVIKLIENQWDVEEMEGSITCDTTPDELGFDSLDVIELVMDLENYFNVQLELSALENVNTIGQMVELIEKELKCQYQ